MTTRIDLIDEPLITPVAPGTALVRLSQTTGALRQLPDFGGAAAAELIRPLQNARQSLMEALEGGAHAALATALKQAQDCLQGLYTTVETRLQGATSDQAAAIFRALDFPPPGPSLLQPVDVTRVLCTFCKPAKQVVTNLVFQDAPAATAYWLHEIRNINGEDVEDDMLESLVPQFPRLRLPLGLHRMRIVARNPSYSAASEEFTITVPAI